MQRRNFVKSSLLSASALSAGLSLSAAENKATAKEFYELRVYDLKEATSQASLDDYLSIRKKVMEDESYKKASAAYNAIPKDKNVYTRYTTSLMIAFDGF